VEFLWITLGKPGNVESYPQVIHNFEMKKKSTGTLYADNNLTFYAIYRVATLKFNNLVIVIHNSTDPTTTIYNLDILVVVE
jgi:hypothetical protein